MMLSNVTLTNFVCRPNSAASALPKSTSMPSIVLPSVPMNSSGGYDASAAMVNVPLLLIAGGTRAAAAALTELVGVLEPVLVDPPPVDFLLLEHPESTTAPTTARTTPAENTRYRWDTLTS